MTEELPHNLEAEQFLLGAVLVEPDRLVSLSHVLRPDHFFDPVHGRLFGTMCEMAELGQRVDLVTLRDHVRDIGLLDEIGGEDYLRQIASQVPAVSGALDYAKAIIATAQRRLLIEAGEEMIRRAQEGGVGFQPNECLDNALLGLQGGLIADLATHQPYLPLGTAAQRALIAAEEMARGARVAPGVSTGMPLVDRNLGRLVPGRLIVIAGITGHGKSSLAMQWGVAAAKEFAKDTSGDRRSVMMFSLEMSDEELAQRVLAAECDTDSRRIALGEMSQAAYERMYAWVEQNRDLPLLIDRTARASQARIMSTVRAFARQSPLGLVVIDYLQRIRFERSRGRTRDEELGDMTGALKEMASELKIPILLVSQLNRANKDRADKRPVLSDLRGSGSIEQDANQVLFVHRADEMSTGAELIIAKNRHGIVGTVLARFDGWASRFTEEPETREAER